jgi:hypothetical protein
MAKRTSSTPKKSGGSTTGKAGKAPAAVAAQRVVSGRSGGVVDAPGKRHRKPLPSDPGASLADSQAAKLRAALPMTKTNRLRGRG